MGLLEPRSWFSGRRSAKEWTDEEWVRRLQANDADAWSEFLVSDYSQRLYNYLRHKLPEEQDVEDILQETMTAAVTAIQTFDGKAKLTTFLFSLANYKVADFWRKRQVTTELTDIHIDPGMNAESVEFVEILQKLREEHRQVLLMRYYVGLGVDEIARILGKTYKGAESLLSRARAELRKGLDGEDEI
ncbi:MAG: RNA polymerase sigma factor [Caldilineaceae bacterium]|nr:RNA polymerase sigma factor [Caldilineaceae bacterium]MCB0120624.1 RNA polymerase sigma factor [Caldilineaceae bacterium]